MNHVLKVDASMRMEGSQSRNLVAELIKKLTAVQTVTVLSRDLAEGVPFVDAAWIEANFTAPQQRSAEHHKALAYSDVLVNELRDADTLVVGLPIYNFHVPAAFKAWIDLVARVHETFRYSSQGAEGLLKGKQAYIVIVSTGTQLGSPIDFVSDYIRHMLGFLGIDNVTIIDGSAGKFDAALQQIRNIDAEEILAV